MINRYMLTFHLISAFPNMFESYLNMSILGRAQKKKLIAIKTINLKDFASGKHRSIDDSPYGGGPGMVLKFEPLYKAARSIQKKISRKTKTKSRVILFSTRGKKFNDNTAKRLSHYTDLIFICGRYEGVDERVAGYIADEEISIGEYVLSGGELPAMVLIDAISRKISGVLGRKESLEEIKGSYPVYTKPVVTTVILKNKRKRKLTVPDVLLFGNHKKIAEWRKENGSLSL